MQFKNFTYSKSVHLLLLSYLHSKLCSNESSKTSQLSHRNSFPLPFIEQPATNISSWGLDISLKILLKFPDNALKLLTETINLSFTSEAFPRCLKMTYSCIEVTIITHHQTLGQFLYCLYSRKLFRKLYGKEYLLSQP